jgi:antitoxin PrlF
MHAVACRVSSKGQVTIPKKVRDGLGLRQGDEVEFVVEGGAYRLRKVLRTNPFARYRGYLSDLAGRDPDALVRGLRGDDHRG